MEYPIAMTSREVAEQIGTNHSIVLEYARRKDDPLPLRYIKGRVKGGFVIVAELIDWIERNTCTYNERRDYANK